MLTQKQQYQRMKMRDDVFRALDGVDSTAKCLAILEYILSDTTLSPADLNDLGNRVSREAWVREREPRNPTPNSEPTETGDF